MNEISILSFTFTDDQIKGGSLSLANSMLCNELSADEVTFDIYEGAANQLYLFASGGEQLFAIDGSALIANEGQGQTLDFNTVPYGTPFVFIHDGSVIGKFYIKEVTQTGPLFWRITGQSAIGLLITQEHNGGIYTVANGDTVQSVIDEIMAGSNITYTVSDAIKNQYVAGWLPAGSCRDSLQQLGFAYGISVLKDENGDLLFDFNEPDMPEAALLEDNIYMGGSKTLLAPASKVTVYEHAFAPITTETPVIVFDNTGDTAAVNQKIVFDNPVIVSTITTTGTITISESGANYAVVSGTGTINAVEYTHTTKALEQSTGATSTESKEVVIKDAYLVNALNSANCLNRVAAYYTQANEVDCSFVVDAERPGELVTYPDPFDTVTQKAGLIKQMNITVSGILKSASKLTENWLPDYLGNNYTDYELIDDGASWTADVTGTVRIILVGGGQGGQAGQAGESGTAYQVGEMGTGYGGNGGEGGSGGNPGKLFATDIAVTQGTTYTISIGTGGAGGTSNGALGTDGTDTTITIGGTTYTSADGAEPEYGYVNAISGDIYATKGSIGVAGADGGDSGMAGQGLTYEGVTYTGGQAGAAGSEGGGGGGGGAAVGANGQDGFNGGSYYEGKGGNGASPIAATGNAGLGGGGNGGHGAGGGGGTGASHYWPAGGGAGGTGGQGATGGNGFILIYK